MAENQFGVLYSQLLFKAVSKITFRVSLLPRNPACRYRTEDARQYLQKNVSFFGHSSSKILLLSFFPTCTEIILSVFVLSSLAFFYIQTGNWTRTGYKCLLKITMCFCLALGKGIYALNAPRNCIGLGANIAVASEMLILYSPERNKDVVVNNTEKWFVLNGAMSGSIYLYILQ